MAMRRRRRTRKLVMLKHESTLAVEKNQRIPGRHYERNGAQTNKNSWDSMSILLIVDPNCFFFWTTHAHYGLQLKRHTSGRLIVHSSRANRPFLSTKPLSAEKESPRRSREAPSDQLASDFTNSNQGLHRSLYAHT